MTWIEKNAANFVGKHIPAAIIMHRITKEFLYIYNIYYSYEDDFNADIKQVSKPIQIS